MGDEAGGELVGSFLPIPHKLVNNERPKQIRKVVGRQLDHSAKVYC